MSAKADLQALAASISTSSQALAALGECIARLQRAMELVDSFTVLDHLAGTTSEAVSLLSQEVDYCTRVAGEISGGEPRPLTDLEQRKVTLALRQAGSGIDLISAAAADAGYDTLAADVVAGIRQAIIAAAAAAAAAVEWAAETAGKAGKDVLKNAWPLATIVLFVAAAVLIGPSLIGKAATR